MRAVILFMIVGSVCASCAVTRVGGSYDTHVSNAGTTGLTLYGEFRSPHAAHVATGVSDEIGLTDTRMEEGEQIVEADGVKRILYVEIGGGRRFTRVIRVFANDTGRLAYHGLLGVSGSMSTHLKSKGFDFIDVEVDVPGLAIGSSLNLIGGGGIEASYFLLASRCLAQFGKPIERPSLDWICIFSIGVIMPTDGEKGS